MTGFGSFDNSTCKRVLDLLEVFIKYEAKVSSRVGGGERGVVDFGKLFTETNEQN